MGGHTQHQQLHLLLTSLALLVQLLVDALAPRDGRSPSLVHVGQRQRLEQNTTLVSGFQSGQAQHQTANRKSQERQTRQRTRQLANRQSQEREHRQHSVRQQNIKK